MQDEEGSIELIESRVLSLLKQRVLRVTHPGPVRIAWYNNKHFVFYLMGTQKTPSLLSHLHSSTKHPSDSANCIKSS